jgi:hypothetical protein
MSFTDVLRAARGGRTTILHQFLTTYNPSRNRVHLFVEGDVDPVFYEFFLRPYLEDKTSVSHVCGGKPKVFEIFAEVTKRYPACKDVLFFVDKDLDDLLASPIPTDPRIYTTDSYSVESFFANRGVVGSFLASNVKVRGTVIDLAPVLEAFDKQLDGFNRSISPVMAWIVAVRRTGGRPNLADVKAGELALINQAGIVQSRWGKRYAYLSRVTGLAVGTVSWREVLSACRQVSRLEPKQYVRGKFHAWFVATFIKFAVAQMGRVAAEVNGSVSTALHIEPGNVVRLMLPGIQIPASLERFFEFHFSKPQPSTMEPTPRSLLDRMATALLRLLRLLKGSLFFA